MASMRDIKRRKSSVESTQQITKAMKLVSTVKLQKAKARAEQSAAYFEAIFNTVNSILAKSGNIEHPYLKAGASDKKAVIMITSNKGLAGGYNSNIIKMVSRDSRFTKENTVVYAIGKKGKDAMERLGYEIKKDYSDVIDNPLYNDAMNIQKDVLAAFEAGEIGEIYLAYTFFKNTVSHIPTLLELLPVSSETVSGNEETAGLEENSETTAVSTTEEEKDIIPMNFEPEEDEALDMIIPKYITSLLFGAFVEAVASENGARMQAMDSATNNAAEMIDHLSLLYNRARQSSITQELTEIIAGADAIN
ncbi:MAG: ATP synthase F1 subunit gamma [Lachnospiraceae bacterium]